METWGATRYGDPCTECGFDWSISTADAIELVRHVPAELGVLLEGRRGDERHPDLGWTAAGYVRHVADNLETWATWLTAALLDDRPTAPGYDPDALAAAHGYASATPRATLCALEVAVGTWTSALLDAIAAGTVLEHARRGPQSAADIAHNNAHDAHHHVHDVRRILAANLAGRAGLEGLLGEDLGVPSANAADKSPSCANPGVVEVDYGRPEATAFGGSSMQAV